MMACKNALKETHGDVDAAVDYLRQKGLAGADKKSGRITTEGLIVEYIHQGSGCAPPPRQLQQKSVETRTHAAPCGAVTCEMWPTEFKRWMAL